jgi:predicted membrane-bound dolichyl-phosphate-mannose-protein mannosyltransferase
MTDWTDQVADAIEGAVTTVRDKTVIPAEKVVRAIVAGVVAGILAATAGLLAALGVFRLLDVYLPGPVWVPYLILGGILTIVGLFFWSRR